MVRKNKLLLLLSIFLLLVVNSGCLQRKLTVRTEPGGAEVYFNDKYMGTTPAEFDFEWYWKHLVVIKKEGYKDIKNYETIKAPPYLWIPFDLVIELLPVTIKDYRELTYELEPEEKQFDTIEDIEIEEIDFGPAGEGTGNEKNN